MAWHTHKTLGVVWEGAVQHVCHTLSFVVTSGGGVQVRQCLDEWCVMSAAKYALSWGVSVSSRGCVANRE